MSAVERCLTWFVPWRAEAPVDERYAADLVSGVSLLFGALAIFACLETSVMDSEAPRLAQLCAAGAILFFGNLLLVRHRRWSFAARVAMVAELLVLLGLAAAFSRGYRTLNVGWQVCLPLIAVYLLGVRAGVITGALNVLEAVGLWWLEHHRLYVPPSAGQEAPAANVLLFGAVLAAVVVGIGYIYERAHAARRKSLSDTIVQLEAAHRELAAAQKKLIASEKLTSLGLLAAGVAHEINNPMAYVTANISGMQGDLDALTTDEELRREYLEEILPATLDGVQRVNAIVGDLRRFARGDQERFVEYDLNKEIAAAMRMAHSELKKRETRVDIDLGPVPKVLGLPRQIMQVVMNLVVNAAQASDVGGTIRIASWSAGDEASIKVQDTGAGMTKETRDQLFQPFFTTKPVGEGTGLGLSVAHGIVAAHGGRIDVDSSPGRGAAFTIVLPLVPPVQLPSLKGISP